LVTRCFPDINAAIFFGENSTRVLSNVDRNRLSKSVMENAGSISKSLKRCLQSEDVIRYWEALSSVGEGKPFFNTTYLSSKWSEKTIHQPGGGVSNNFCGGLNILTTLQLFVEIVCEAAHFLKVLFSPFALYVEQDLERSKKHKEYQKMQAGTEPKELLEWIESLQTSTWDSYDNPKGDPEWSMFTSLLLRELDKLNEQWLEEDGRLMFSKPEGNNYSAKGLKYWQDVRKLVKKYVHPSDDDEAKWRVSENICSKVDWYFYESAQKHRLVIPILTPKMLDALAANITAGAKAYEEVSDFLI
jgi:hypothetical protein